MSRQQPHREAHAAPGKVGFLVFFILAIMTIVEYAIATQMESKLLLLVAIAFAKAALILWYFMHLARAWLLSRGAHE